MPHVSYRLTRDANRCILAARNGPFWEPIGTFDYDADTWALMTDFVESERLVDPCDVAALECLRAAVRMEEVEHAR